MSDEKDRLDMEKAMFMIKSVYDDGEMTINGRSYVFGAMTHKTRRSVYAYMTGIAPMIKTGNMSFLGTDEWDKIEQLMCGVILFEDSQLSKLPRHWDNYPGDYLTFCTTAMQVISHPFLAGNPTA